jgi:hypothetical protein
VDRSQRRLAPPAPRAPGLGPRLHEGRLGWAFGRSATNWDLTRGQIICDTRRGPLCLLIRAHRVRSTGFENRRDVGRPGGKTNDRNRRLERA